MTRTWAVPADHDVVGLEVAVDEPLFVRGREPPPRGHEIFRISCQLRASDAPSR